MNIIDLTHTISTDMPVFPGTEQPSLEIANTYEKDGFKETLLTMYSHTGTHMDAPMHLYNNRTSLDSFPVSQFTGYGTVIDCTSLKPNDKITLDFIKPFLPLKDFDFILFYTGWSDKWNQDSYFSDFPTLDSSVIDYFIQHPVKGIGLDTISLDPMEDSNLTLHKKLLKNTDTVIIENLKNLNLLLNISFEFFALPLKFSNSDGAPVRAIAKTA